MVPAGAGTGQECWWIGGGGRGWGTTAPRRLLVLLPTASDDTVIVAVWCRNRASSPTNRREVLGEVESGILVVCGGLSVGKIV